jgi:signal transduction histidine kinase
MSDTRRVRSKSLLRRVTISFAVVAIVTMLAEVVLVALKYGLSHEVLIASGTEHEADRIIGYVTSRPDGTLTLDLPKIAAEPFARYPLDYGFEALLGDGSVIGGANRTLFDKVMFLPKWDQDMSWKTVRRPEGSFGILMHRYEIAGTEVSVRVTLGRDPAGLRWWLMRDEMIDHVLMPMVPLTLVMLAANIFVLRRSLRPLATTARRAEAIDAGRGGLRLEVADLPTEIVPLVRAINDALARVDQVLRFQRDFTAMVAHELRTPLAVLTLQLGGRAGLGDDAALAVVTEMTHLVNQLLTVAQLEESATEALEPVPLGNVAQEVVTRLVPLALDRDREIAFEDRGAAIVLGHRNAIANALRNLIENALRATPAGSTVVVTSGPGASLVVRDSGPGVPNELKDSLFTPFMQGTPHHDGAGLGLAIVAKTMGLHGGRVWFENLPDGCAFHLDFPPSAG